MRKLIIPRQNVDRLVDLAAQRNPSAVRRVEAAFFNALGRGFVPELAAVKLRVENPPGISMPLDKRDVDAEGIKLRVDWNEDVFLCAVDARRHVTDLFLRALFTQFGKRTPETELDEPASWPRFTIRVAMFPSSPAAATFGRKKLAAEKTVQFKVELFDWKRAGTAIQVALYSDNSPAGLIELKEGVTGPDRKALLLFTSVPEELVRNGLLKIYEVGKRQP